MNAISSISPCGAAVVALAAALALAAGAVSAGLPAPADPQGGRLCIRGVYPHLAVFNSTPDGQGGTRGGGGECGIGAVVPWAGRLWLLTYSPHCPTGSTDKLYAIDPDLRMETRPESLGGTPAGRMIHRESRQLFIGPYAIDEQGKVRAIPYSRMPGRHTAVARHLTDPADLVYYFDMEGKVYEVNVHTLEVKLLFTKPAPGIHGKGAYTGQGRYVIANNGEGGRGGPDDEEMGVLAEYDGKEWRTIERKQFCDVTGPGGILGAPDDDGNSPVWAIGWDRRSVILKLLDGGRWHTFRLPKASHTYDHRGGWYTEWPRIRRIAPGKVLMDMHAMFWDFPAGFRAGATGGLRPISTHHRYVPDFCEWRGQVVIATDETTIMANPLAGQAQSNLWFGQVEDLYGWGPCIGWGGPWVLDAVKAGEPSVPFHMNGFSQRCLHLAVGGKRESAARAATGGGPDRCTGSLPMAELPPELAGLARVTIARGDYHKPAPPWAFTVNRDVVVFLAVDDRPKAQLGEGWERTDLKTRWRDDTDTVYRKAFSAGRIDVPGHPLAHKPDAYGLPHLCFVQPAAGEAGSLEIAGLPENLGARVSQPSPPTPPTPGPDAPAPRPGGDVTFTLEIDARGDGRWTEYARLAVPDEGYRWHIFPPTLAANWVRLTADRDCVATACFHYSQPGHDPKDGRDLFAAVAGLDEESPCAGLIRPAGHNTNLQFLAAASGDADAGTYYEVDQALAFRTPQPSRAEEVLKIASVSKDFEADDASVIMTEGSRRFRLPKGDLRYEKPFAAGWPRGIRECESERYLMSIHGTFYEKPREGGMWKIKPIATHNRQIMDFCTWRGLLVLAGTKRSARPDGQYFQAAEGTGLWFGAIDDLWSFGKPVGTGGPWLKTAVRPGQPSDPYLMTGYDRKRIELSHDADGPVNVTVEVNPDHITWRQYRAFAVPPGRTVAHEFPEGFCAHWLRVRADKACHATAVLTYQ